MAAIKERLVTFHGYVDDFKRWVEKSLEAAQTHDIIAIYIEIH